MDDLQLARWANAHLRAAYTLTPVPGVDGVVVTMWLLPRDPDIDHVAHFGEVVTRLRARVMGEELGALDPCLTVIASDGVVPGTANIVIADDTITLGPFDAPAEWREYARLATDVLVVIDPRPYPPTDAAGTNLIDQLTSAPITSPAVLMAYDDADR